MTSPLDVPTAQYVATHLEIFLNHCFVRLNSELRFVDYRTVTETMRAMLSDSAAIR